MEEECGVRGFRAAVKGGRGGGGEVVEEEGGRGACGEESRVAVERQGGQTRGRGMPLEGDGRGGRDGLVAVGRGSRGEENGLAFEEEGGGDGELGVRVRLGGESVNINWWEARGGAGVPVVGRRGAGRHFSTRSSFLRRRL